MGDFLHDSMVVQTLEGVLSYQVKSETCQSNANHVTHSNVLDTHESQVDTVLYRTIEVHDDNGVDQS